LSQLTFTKNHRRFSLPANATNFQVFVIENRGLKPCLLDDGSPLIVSTDLGRDGLFAAVDHEPGRYKLVALDDSLNPVPDVPSAYVTFPPRVEVEPEPTAREPEPMTARAPAGVGDALASVGVPGAWTALPVPPSLTPAEYMLAEAFRTQAQEKLETSRVFTAALTAQAQALATGATQMMQVLAEVLRARHVEPPRRNAEVGPFAAPWMAFDPRYAVPPITVAPVAAPALSPVEDDGPDAAAPAVVSPAVPGWMDKIVEGLGNIATATGNVREMMGAGLGAAMVPGLGAAITADDSVPRNAAEPDPEPPFRLTSAMSTHMAIVHRGLGHDEALFRKVFKHLDPDERARRVTHLCTLEVDEAIEQAAAWLAPVKKRIAQRARSRGIPGAPQATSPGTASVTAQGTSPGMGGGTAAEIVPSNGADASSTTVSDARAPEPERTFPHSDVETGAASGANGHADLEDDAAHDEDGVDPNDGDVDLAGLSPTNQPTSALRSSVTRAGAEPPTFVDAAQAIQRVASLLSPGEKMRVMLLAKGMSEQDRTAWMAKLAPMPPEHAVAVIRTQLARAG